MPRKLPTRQRFSMRFVDEFWDVDPMGRLVRAFQAEKRPERRYQLREFCGGHTHAIARQGLDHLLDHPRPEQVCLIHGPGRPICVLPASRIDMAISLALEDGVTLRVWSTD
jgi:hydrogenase expression/formation protein HypD